MKILLTGGSGMVGRNILEHANAYKYEILCPSRKVVDLTDEIATRQYVAEVSPDIIVHAAGTVGGIQANIAEPVRFLTENLNLGVNIITAARAANVKRLLNISSSCIYPKNAANPILESQILTGELEPTNEGYALAKIVAAKLCDYTNREDRSLKYKTIIPCNLYGRHDKFDPRASHMVPAIIRKINDAVKEKATVVEIWGDGTARREFMYAGDLAGFVFCAIERFDELPDLLNIGMGFDLSVNEYYHLIAGMLGFTGEFRYDLTKPSGVKQKLVDVTSLNIFGWTPTVSFAEGVTKTVEYMNSKGQK